MSNLGIEGWNIQHATKFLLASSPQNGSIYCCGRCCLPIKNIPDEAIPWPKPHHKKTHLQLQPVICTHGGKHVCILASRWRVFYQHVLLKPDKVHSPIDNACILHKLNVTQEGEQQNLCLCTLRNIGGNCGSTAAFDVTEVLCDFFNSPEGSVSCDVNITP